MRRAHTPAISFWSQPTGERQPLLSASSTPINPDSRPYSPSSSSSSSSSSSASSTSGYNTLNQSYYTQSSRHNEATNSNTNQGVHILTRQASFRRMASTPLYSCEVDQRLTHPVYMNIHRIRRDIQAVVEDYLSIEQLQDVRINIAVVRPLVDKLYDMEDVSIVYCLMVNRAKFLAEQSTSHSRNNVNFTRATLCELIASRILRRYGEDAAPDDRLLLMANILLAGFHPFLNAPPDVVEEADESLWVGLKPLPALEVAIVTESKLFLASTPCQRVISAIYEGRVIYTPSSFFDLIPDHYKKTPIMLYNPRESQVLNQYRLIVPRNRKALDQVQFLILLVLYFFFMSERDPTILSWREICFGMYTFGWCIDQVATILMHGWGIYSQNLWSFLDVGFMLLYGLYVALRTYGSIAGEAGMSIQGIDLLAMAAPILVPRLAFNIMSNNMVFLSIRAMISDFTLLTILSAWCFCGFLVALYWLGDGQESPWIIGKLLLWIWFGLDGTGISESVNFHPLLGPALSVAFAFLGNTLFLTVFVSILSNTFARISRDSTAEIQFRTAVLTLEAVKSDAIFAYQPPFNIIAILILVPLKLILSPRWFHKIHVAAVRAVNLPVLLVIAFLERYILNTFRNLPTPSNVPKKPISPVWWQKFRFTFHPDLAAVFDHPPPDSIEEAIAADDDFTHHLIRKQYMRPKPARRRRDSTFGEMGQGGVSSLSGIEGTEEGTLAEMAKRLERAEKIAEQADERMKRIEELLIKYTET